MLHVALADIKTADVTHYSYHYLGQIYGELGRYDEAIRVTSEGMEIARSMKDEAAARKESTYSLLQIAHLQRKAGRCQQALANYDQVLRVFDEMELGAFKYDARKGRLLCHVALDDDAEIEAELPVVFEQFNEYRAMIVEEQNTNSFFDREQGVYDIAIDHAYAKGEALRALAYSEESRARSLLSTLRGGARTTSPGEDSAPQGVAQPLSPREIQERMPADVQVIQYAVLDDKTLVWLITKEAISNAKITIAADDLRAKISDYADGISHAPADSRENLHRLARELYDTLVGPVAARLDPGKDVCVIPDKAVALLPFSALISTQTGRYLVEEFSIQYAPSLNVFVHCSEAARGKSAAGAESLLSVGNPSFDGEDYPALAPLPAAADEVRAIARYYSPVHEFVGPNAVREEVEPRLADAEVIHFAGHYVVDDRDPMSSRLVLAKGRGRVGTDDGSLSARALAGRKLPRAKLVVLSACRTGADGYYNGEGVISLGRTFLGAGIPLVVASQWAVDSAATAELMTKFHRYRKTQDMSTVAALRRAQLEMLDAPDGLYSDPYYWAAFLPMGGHVSY
jgi:CHAT domain-containing protein